MIDYKFQAGCFIRHTVRGSHDAGFDDVKVDSTVEGSLIQGSQNRRYRDLKVKVFRSWHIIIRVVFIINLINAAFFLGSHNTLIVAV